MRVISFGYILGKKKEFVDGLDVEFEKKNVRCVRARCGAEQLDPEWPVSEPEKTAQRLAGREGVVQVWI